MTDQEIILNLYHAERVYAIFCNFTHMPYIECDEESYSDMAFIFLEEEQAKEFALTYKDGKKSLVAVRIEQSFLKHFLASLIAEGFDTVKIHAKETRMISIDQLITRTLQEGVKKPIENPALQLSMMYFLQDVQNAQTEEEKEEVQRKEEEMMANIARAVYLVPFIESEEKNPDEGKKNISLIHLKNDAGELFIPLFTDMDEFLKIHPKEETRNFIPMSFQRICEIKKMNPIQFIINPGSVHIQLNQHNIDAVDYRFGNQSK